MMRSIRDKLSAPFEGMTLEEELEWLASRDLEDPLLRDKAVQRTTIHVADDRQAVRLP